MRIGNEPQESLHTPLLNTLGWTEESRKTTSDDFIAKATFVPSKMRGDRFLDESRLVGEPLESHSG